MNVYINKSNDNRLYFMDALRGVAIIAVVYYHFIIYYLNTDTFFNDFSVLWKMPLFFFISGFFSYSLNYDLHKLKLNVKKRVLRQLYPTFSTCLLYVLCILLFYPGLDAKETLLHTIYDPAKRGYWFTFSLIQVFFLLVFLLYIFKRKNTPKQTQAFIIGILIIASSIAALFCFRDLENGPSVVRQAVSVLSLEKTIELLPFFLFGVLCKIYEKNFLKIIANPIVILISIVSFLTLDLVFEGDFVYYLKRWTLLICIVSIFAVFQSFLTPSKTLGKYLLRLGKNTLPVYLFHFFVLLLLSVYAEQYIPSIKNSLINPFVEIPVVCIISMLITEVVLYFEKFLKKTSLLHKLIYSY